MTHLSPLTAIAAAALGLTLLVGCSTAAPADETDTAPASSASALAADGLQTPAATEEQAVVAPPVRVRIPDIGVDAPLEDLRRDDAGVLLPPEEWMSAGWYVDGVRPGATGPAIIAGHVDTFDQVAVFVDLEKLRPGARIEVDRADGTSVAFAMDRMVDVAKKEFPTEEVYGPTVGSELRLITCNGPFDDAENRYANNVVVFATALPA
jgi:sortase (surface protein transpeptidase)